MKEILPWNEKVVAFLLSFFWKNWHWHRGRCKVVTKVAISGLAALQIMKHGAEKGQNVAGAKKRPKCYRGGINARNVEVTTAGIDTRCNYWTRYVRIKIENDFERKLEDRKEQSHRNTPELGRRIWRKTTITLETRSHQLMKQFNLAQQPISN